VDHTQTRIALHGVAELLLAGPQYAVSNDIRLRVLPYGIATVAAPDLRLVETDLVGAHGRVPLSGTYAEVAAAAGITPRELGDVYRDRAPVTAGDRIVLDPERLATLVRALVVGDAALRAFAPEAVPVLWPEHLDVAIQAGAVNYGVSPGDAHLAEPYAYVGPWEPRTGPFWDQPFGAARPVADLGDSAGVLAFFREGARRAASDPAADETP
jgi:hypothetical protein